MSAYGLKRAVVSDLPLFSGAAEPRVTGAALPRRATYPDHPGAKAAGTSTEAADAVASEARILRELVLAALREHGPSTADEIASHIGVSILSCRPRCSELRKMGLVFATGERRKNDSGHSAEVLTVEPTRKEA